MLKRIMITLFVVLLTSAASVAFASGGCPDSANSLEAYAGCMAVMPGNTGTMYRGNLYQLQNNSHADVIAAMQAAPVVPPHVVAGPAYYVATPRPYIPSMMNVAAARAYQTGNHRTFWTGYMLSNAMMQMPYVYP